MKSLVISDRDFEQLMAKRSRKLFELAKYVSELESSEKALNRPLLGELLSQSIQLEELLDTYGAANNCRWCQLRSLTAAMKLFTDVSYEILHIQHAFPAYRLLPIEHDFVKATGQALRFTADVILQTAKGTVEQAYELGLAEDLKSDHRQEYAKQLPAGRLTHNCSRVRTETISETVSLLATAFLNLAAESEHVHTAVRAQPAEYGQYVLESASEENLRAMELRFHNLQSLYDTHVSGREAENLDKDLPVLRGHISVVFHLLKTATLFAHYYERHVNKPVCSLLAAREPLVSAEALLTVLVEYSAAYISYYIDSARNLCQAMLKRYIEVDRIEVPVPPYRGFHVRPATLIAKLVQHYGSEVRMELEDERYDAAAALELFRANEKLNAQKRRWLAEEISRLNIVPSQAQDKDMTSILQNVVLALTEQSKLVVYEQPLQLQYQPDERQKQQPLAEQIISQIARLQTIGKVDIDTDLKVTFVGDRRVLADIRLLAESGYGENSLGNNVELPKELAYLRR